MIRGAVNLALAGSLATLGTIEVAHTRDLSENEALYTVSFKGRCSTSAAVEVPLGSR